MLFFVYTHKALNWLSFALNHTLSVCSVTIKFIKRELSLLSYSLCSVLGLAKNQTWPTGLGNFLTKKNYFLRDFVFFWKYFSSPNVVEENVSLRRYSTSASNFVGPYDNNSNQTYQIITANPFLFKVYNTGTVNQYNTYLLTKTLVTVFITVRCEF